MELELKAVSSHGLAPTLDLLNRSFTDYVVPISLDEAAFGRWLHLDGIDADSSRVIIVDGQAVGVALVARRARASRLAAMAILPGSRGRGAGQRTMELLMDQARNRGDRSMELEVIEGNQPAINLYRRCGFRTLRRLVSYALAGAQGEETPPLQPCHLADMARLVQAHGLPDLPWQISSQSLARLGPPNAAYRLDSAYVAIANPEVDAVHIRSILVEPQARRQGQATALLKALVATYPGRSWHISPLCPEELGGLFVKAGFDLEPLAQFQMRTSL